MAESIVQVTEGSGKKLHTNSYTVGANTVEDEFVVPGPNPYPTFCATFANVSLAVANDHIACLNAGGTNKIRVHRVRIEQATSATTATGATFSILRTTTGAPTGGTAVTPASFDTADSPGEAGRQLPAVKGTESTELMRCVVAMRQTFAAAGTQVDDAWEWMQSPMGKPITVPVGATNGLVVKSTAAVAAATVHVLIEYTATPF